VELVEEHLSQFRISSENQTVYKFFSVSRTGGYLTNLELKGLSGLQSLRNRPATHKKNCSPFI